MHHEVRLGERAGGRDKEFAELARTFLVAPIADPNHVGIFCGGYGSEVFDVGSFMEGPYVLHAKSIGVNTPDRIAKSEDTVEEMKMEAQQVARTGIGAVMGV